METLITKVQMFTVWALAGLLVIVVMLSTVHLGVLVGEEIWTPPRFLIRVQARTHIVIVIGRCVGPGNNSQCRRAACGSSRLVRDLHLKRRSIVRQGHRWRCVGGTGRPGDRRTVLLPLIGDSCSLCDDVKRCSLQCVSSSIHGRGGDGGRLNS